MYTNIIIFLPKQLYNFNNYLYVCCRIHIKELNYIVYRNTIQKWVIKALLLKEIGKNPIKMKVPFLAAIFNNGYHGGHFGFFVGVSFFF